MSETFSVLVVKTGQEGPKGEKGVQKGPTKPSPPSSPPTNLPSFPLCQEMRARDGGETVMFSCLCVFRTLENRSQRKHLGRRISVYAQSVQNDHHVCQRAPTHEWNATDCQWEPVDAKESNGPEWMVSADHLEDFATWCLVRARKTTREKVNLLRKLNIKRDESKLPEAPIEQQVIDELRKMCPYRVDTQHRVGKYRLDAFIPRLRIAIQIDEHDHSGYDTDEEKDYDDAVRSNNMVLVRFNPHTKDRMVGTPGQELVKRMWERTLSPDYQAFSREQKLC